MRTPPLILVVDDNPMNLDILQTRLSVHGYDILTAADGEEALAVAREKLPDLILLDIMMPKLDGIEVCKRLKADPSLPIMPIIMVTAKADSKDIVAGLDAGGDEYLTKPLDQAALVARVKSMLRAKALHDTVQEQAARLEAQAAELAQLNRTLEKRVQEQVSELDRVGRLKRFFSPQLAELIVSGGAEDPLRSHRREVTVVFADLRGFTAFCEAADPEEIVLVLREYHAVVGRRVTEFEATLEHFAGDGVHLFFNDPVEQGDHRLRALRMTVALRSDVAGLQAQWDRRGVHLGFGVGVSVGHATAGRIGFEGRYAYAVVGTIVNLAARLSAEAAAGQILVTDELYRDIADGVEAERIDGLSLKGISHPVTAWNVVGLRG